MMKVIQLEVETQMSNRELIAWLKKAIERQNEADPAKRQVELTQKPHVQAVNEKKHE